MAITKIQSESLNLADNYDFTGTVTGAGDTTKPSFYAKANTGQSISNATETVLQFNNEIFDSNSCFDTGTYRFTPTTAGKYYIFGQYACNTSTDCFQAFYIYKNASLQTQLINRNFDTDSVFVATVFDMNGSSDYAELRYYQESGGAITLSNTQHMGFGGFKIG